MILVFYACRHQSCHLLQLSRRAETHLKLGTLILDAMAIVLSHLATTYPMTQLRGIVVSTFLNPEIDRYGFEVGRHLICNLINIYMLKYADCV